MEHKSTEINNQPEMGLTRKRRYDEENNRISKRPKTELMPELNFIPTTTLTDVNNDCLEAIFMYLNLADLLNITETSKQLKPAADYVAVKKKIVKEVSWWPEFPLDENSSGFIEKVDIARYLKGKLRVLRCFGHLISNLTIDRSSSGKFGKETEKVCLYTNQYCRKTLTGITLLHISEDIFNHVEEPFPKVETVILESCLLPPSAALNKWFPKIRTLEINNITANHSSMSVHLPQLEELCIHSMKATNTTNTRNLFRLNPQLRNIQLDTDNTLTFLCYANDNLKQLEKLEIHWNLTRFKKFRGNVIKFKKLTHLKITNDFWQPHWQLAMIPITFEQLEEFTYNVLHLYHHIYEYLPFNPFLNEPFPGDALINFLKRNPSIIKLNVESNDVRNFSEDTSSKIVEALPLLHEVNFIRFRLSCTNVIGFTENGKSLKTIRCQMNDSEFKRLKRDLVKGWQVTKHNGNAMVERQD